MVAANAPGTAIAANRKANRVAAAPMTRSVKRGSAGDASAAISARPSPIGNRNHPDLPKSVTSLKGATTHRGRWSTVSTAQASTKIISPTITISDVTAHAPMRAYDGHLGFTAVRGARTSFRTAQATLVQAQRGQDGERPTPAAPPVTVMANLPSGRPRSK